MEPLLAWELANTATGFATCLAGVMTLALTAGMGAQPIRWWIVYVCILVTGLFTVTYHGLGETHGWKVLDVGSNLVVVWAVISAAEGDFRAGRRWGTLGAGAVVCVVVPWMWLVPSTTDVQATLTFGAWGGYMVGEIVLIGLALSALGMFVVHRAQIPAPATPMLVMTGGLFLVGAALSTANGDEVLWRLLPLHALWHIVSAFGFIALWAFNHKRFVELRVA